MKKPAFEIALERGLFASRWLMAPFYVGMVAALALVLVVFAKELWHGLEGMGALDSEAVILLALSLIDLSLTGNLLLIVIFSGYENFVSRIDTATHEERPEWMGTVDFSGLKMKLIASIVAISAIALLRAFLPLAEPAGGAHGAGPDTAKLGWMVGIHLTFVVSGVLLAVMDWLNGKTPKHTGGHD